MALARHGLAGVRMNERVLLIEDDTNLGEQIVDHLRRAGYEPVWWKTGRALSTDDTTQVALVILDLMLPGMPGTDILKALRLESEVPVLVLSARNDSHDKVRALQLGADDYMTKPFWPDELVERVKARLRRPTLKRAEGLEIGPLTIDLEAREVVAFGKRVELTRVEFDLLATLARRPGVPVTRKRLVEHVLDPEREGTERTLDAHVSRLRKKLGGDGLIETVWGIGYRLHVDEPA
jgi:two-component system response regulator MtrA